MEDEDDGQHDCPRCGYNPHAEREALADLEARIADLRDRLEAVDCPGCGGNGYIAIAGLDPDRDPPQCSGCLGKGTRNISRTTRDFFVDRTDELFLQNRDDLEKLWELEGDLP